MASPLSNLAQSYTYTTSTSSGISPVVVIIYLAVLILLIVSMWKLFTKAGKPGWASIIPIYNTIVLLQIAGKPVWWFILYLIPLVNIVISFIVTLEVVKRFGKDAGYAVLTFFLPFIGYPLLAFGDAQYNAGDAAAVSAQPYAPGPQPEVAQPVPTQPEFTPTPPAPTPQPGQVEQPTPPNDQTPPSAPIQ